MTHELMVVEDDLALREVIEWALQDEGYGVTTAENGAVALDLLRGGDSPRLILLDMRMPVMDGWEFARAYSSLPGPHAPLLVITASRDAAEWAGQVDACGYLAKPFGIDDLLRAVERSGGD
jgi:CheY-like chemotaxis protein